MNQSSYVPTMRLRHRTRVPQPTSTRGLGMSPSTISALATAGVLLAILVAMPIIGSLSQRKR